MANSTQSSADVKRAFAQKVIDSRPKGNTNSIVVLPELDTDLEILDNCVVVNPKSKKGFGYVALLQKRTVFSKGVEYDNDLWCIQRGKATSMETRYEAGQLLEGNIVIEDTMVPPNDTDLEQDLKFVSAACREEGVPCTVNGNPIYQIKYWDRTGTVADITIEHDNQDEIAEVNAAANAKNNKANSAGIIAASKKKVKA